MLQFQPAMTVMMTEFHMLKLLSVGFDDMEHIHTLDHDKRRQCQRWEYSNLCWSCLASQIKLTCRQSLSISGLIWSSQLYHMAYTT